MHESQSSSSLYDPFDPLVQEDPYPTYRRLRDEHPVYRNEERSFWALSRFADVWEAVHDPTTFSSAQGIFPTPGDMMTEAFFPMMIMMDPPRHTALRALVSRAFTPRAIAQREASIRTVARELIGAFGEGSCDLVEGLASPLPTIVIADLLGVPRDDRGDFRQWSDHLVQADPADPESSASALAGATRLYEYFGVILAERRERPRDDLVSALLEAEVDDVRLTEEELLGFCFLLLVAGNETTTNLISNAAVLLAEHPDARARVAAEPALLPGAIEEALRVDSPVQGLARTLTRTVELHGEQLVAGDRVLLLYGSANRDEREFPDPDRFDVDRRSDRQLAFGHGVHYCLGASLARLEARIAFEELLAAAPAYEVAGPVERIHSGPIRGLAHLPIEFDVALPAGVNAG